MPLNIGLFVNKLMPTVIFNHWYVEYYFLRSLVIYKIIFKVPFWEIITFFPPKYEIQNSIAYAVI